MIITFGIHTLKRTFRINLPFVFHLTNRDSQVLHRERILVEYTFHSYIDILLLHHIDSFLRDRNCLHLFLRDTVEFHHRCLSNRDTTFLNDIPVFDNRRYRHRCAISLHWPDACWVAIEVFLRLSLQEVIDIRSSFQRTLVEDIDIRIHLCVHWDVWERANILQVVGELIPTGERECKEWCCSIEVRRNDGFSRRCLDKSRCHCRYWHWSVTLDDDNCRGGPDEGNRRIEYQFHRLSVEER